MQNNILAKIEKYIKKYKQYKIWQKIVGSLACVVVFVTTYMLILPAITMEQSTFCEMEEHKHDEKCYKQQLICGYEEESETAHVHNESCYETEQVLICGKEESPGHVHDDSCIKKEQVLICTDTSEEHEHTDACYEEQEVYICGMEEGEGAHTHGPECYEAHQVLICDQPENTPVHTHTEACYKKVLICEKEEHTHTLICFSDPSADVESSKDWERSVSKVKLTGIWADDVIAIAQSQIGYTESTQNYQVQKDGKTIKGYTRYGAWYGDEYGDWCAMFVSFCLNYAEIPQNTVPWESNCSEWIKTLSDSYCKAAGYTPVKGDIIFFDNNGDGTADHVGLVETVNEDNGTLKTIEGNASDRVKENSYSVNDSEILGYGVLPENPEMAAEEDNEDKNGGKTEEEKSSAKAANYAARTQDTEETSDTIATGDDSAAVNGDNRSEMPLNVTDRSGTATYNKDTDTYTVNMTIDFTIDNSDPDTVAQNTYVYTYPEGYPVPAALTEGSHTLHDKAGNEAGTYTFRENDDGTFSVVIQISEDYAKASTTGDEISGYISYKGTMDGNAENEKGGLVIGSGTEQIIIPSEDIEYPDGETHNYNVLTEKNGEYKIENNQLIYTVKVYSTKGTPGEINFEDTIKVDGLTLGKPSVTVQEMSRKDHQTGWIEDWVVNDTPISVDSVVLDDNKTISMTLPKLDQPTVDSDNVKNEKGYLVTYIYDLTDAEAVNVTIDNKVQVSSSDGDSGPTVKDDAGKSVNIDRTLTFEKSGSYDRETGTIKWIVKVNNNRNNIAGTAITDEMFAQAVDGTFKIEPDTNYTYSNNTVTFNPIDNSETNNQTYTITYSTKVDSTWAEQSIDNTAVFDPTPNDSDGGDEIDRTSTVSVGGGSIEKSKVSETIADDKQSAVVEWKVTINVPDSGLPAWTKITDTASDDIWMTRAQVTDWNCVLYWKDTDDQDVGSTAAHYQVPGAHVFFKGSDGNEYSFYQISQNEEGAFDNLTFQLIRIELEKELIPPAGAAKLVFTYKTTIDLSHAEDGWNKYTNTVKVQDKEASAEFNYEVKTPALSKTHGNVTYTKEDEQIKYANIPWTVTIEVPDTGWSIGKTLTDDLTRTQWNEGAAHAITYQEALNMVAGAKWENGTQIDLTDADFYEVKFITKGGTEYTYQALCNITDETLKSSLEFTSFTITPLKIVTRSENETKIVLNVTSRADVSTVEAGGERYYRNWAYIGSNNASSEYPYTNRQNSVVKYDGNWKTGDTTVVSSDGKVYWIIEVQLDNKEHTSVSIEDTLPEGVTLESLKVYMDTKGECYPTVSTEGTAISGTVNGYIITGTYDQSTRVVALQVKKEDGSIIDTGKIQFYINCLVDESMQDNTAYKLKNDVTAKIDETGIGSSSQTQEWTYQEQSTIHDKVTKTGNWDNNARLLEYQVAINPDRLDLVPDSDTLLTLIDELTYTSKSSGYQVTNNNGGTDWVDSEYHFQINLLQNRVKLYYAKVDDNGNLMKDDAGEYLKDGEVSGWSWTYSDSQINEWQTTNTLTITGIPDETPLIMEYAYQVSSDLPEKAYIQNLPINNTAKLKGENQIGSGSHSGGEWKEQTTAGEVDSNKKALKLVKVEKEHYENVLPGAEFSVYKATGTSDDGEMIWSEDVIRTYTTDDTGSFSIEQEENKDGQIFTYDYNTLYKVVETKSPDGYLMPDPVKEYYFYFSDKNDSNTLPSTLPQGSMDLSISAFTVYAENIKKSTDADTTEITVVKKWLDSAENDANSRHDGDTVTLKLYRKAVSDGESGGGEGSTDGSTYSFIVYKNKSWGGEPLRKDSKKEGTIAHISFIDTYGVEYTSLKAVKVNDTEINPKKTAIDNDAAEYSFDVIISENTEVDISFENSNNWRDYEVTYTDPSVEPTSPDDSSETIITDGEYVKECTLKSSDNWTYTFTDLPKTGTDEAGNTVIYYYYVVEDAMSNYTTSYSTTEGITEGTITVTNQADESSGFELPETGGPGTKLYTLGGLLLALSAGIFLLYNYTRRRKEDRSSS